MSDGSKDAAGRRQELLERYLRGTTPAKVDAIPAADRFGPLELSGAQRRMWFLDRLRPGGAEYVVTSAWRLRGDLDVPRLRDAWTRVVRRHEVLRTTYVEHDGAPAQVVGPVVVDFRAVDVEDVAAATLDEAARPFDLAAGPPARLRVLRPPAGDPVLLLVAHHIAYDGWSASVVAKDLAACYEGRERPPLRAQYADFAAWHREHVTGAAVTRGLDHWRARLAGAPVLALPTDRPRPAVHDPRGDLVRFTVDAGVAGRLAGLASAHRATLFAVLLAAYQVLLSRYAGQRDLTVGTPVAGRTRAETHDMVGLFLNTLVLRAEVDPAVAFTDLLGRVRQEVLDALTHQETPFERLVDELSPDRDLSRSPLFQAMFVLQNTERADFSAAGLRGEPLHSPWRSAKFDLTLEITEQPDGALHGVLEYPVALFDRSTVERMAGHFATLLRGVVDDPATRVADLPWLTAGEEAELRRLSGEVVDHPGGTLVDLLGGLGPVVAGDTALTAAELDARSNQAAHRLRALGVGPETVVGVRLERGVELVVALLGVLKAGGAYLPLDPEYPAERLDFMVADSGARLVITPGDLADLDEPDTPVVSGVVPGNAAYVIYTSGSTGLPKGVVVEHRAVVNRLRWAQSVYGLGVSDRVLQKTPFGFDVSVWEFFWTLSVGATLVVAEPGGHRDPEYLARVMVDRGVTVAHFVPSMLRVFLAGSLPVLPLRLVLCSGEVLPGDLAELFHRVVGCGLHNLYGPTEAAVDVTAGRCVPGERVTIGRPVSNTRIHVVDEELRLVPVGVPGELVIAGVQLARGYPGRPALTAERFVPNPFAETPGERLYHTGDLVRLLPDGTIDYLGRIDHQVKLHGNRIEPGEVEAALLRHPAVRAAAVAVHDDRLVGYVVPTAEPPTPAELRDHLARSLPETMLPAAWTVLAALPLTPSGKTDRKALPAPTAVRPPTGFVAPRTSAEEVVAAAFAEATGATRVGAEDGFFELGGDSLRAIRVVGLLRARGVEISVQDLFRRQRVADLAAGLAGAPVAAPLPGVAPFALLAAGQRAALPADVVDAYPLTLAQAGMAHLMLAGVDRGLYVNSLGYPVHDDGAFDLAALREAVRLLTDKHEILRTSIHLADGDVPRQFVHAAAEVELGCTDLRGLDPDTRAARLRDSLAADRARPFDLTRPGLLRLHVHRFTDREWRLTFGYVHAILDGWSQNSLVAELLDAYRAVRSGARWSTTPPAVRFADTVARELVSLESAEDREFWAARVVGVAGFTVPAAWAGEDDGVYRTRRVPIADLPVAAVAAAAGVPLKSLLFAAHLTALRVVSGVTEGDPVFHTGYVTNGRLERADGDLVRGMFLNTVPLLVRSTAGSWAELARDVFAAETASWPHRHFPLPAMQAAWGGATPLVDVFFNHTDMHVLDADLVALDGVEDSTPNEFGLSVSTTPGAFVLEAFTHRVSAHHLELLARVYRHVLERACAGDDPRLVRLPEADREAALRGTPAPPALRATLPGLFAAAVRDHPDAVAVEAGPTTLTYRELDARVSALAARLRAIGIGRGSLVAVLLERGVDTLVAPLAVHRAGAAYVPVDPRYPARRVEHVLTDSGADAVVTGPALTGLLDGTTAPVVLAGEDTGDAAHVTPREPDPDDLAYVIYTSGSTGRPKGVMVGHGALGNFLLSMRDRPGLAAGAAVLALTTVSFDISALELYLPLVVGGRTVIATGDEAVDPHRQVELMTRTGVSVVQATPSGLRVLVDSGWVPPKGLTVLSGGEKLTADLARVLTAGGAELWDLYGPTETTIWSTVARVPADTADPWEPVAGTDVRLLDWRGEPVPPGVVGEVHLGGVGLARGYLGRPALTAERFVPDPHSSTPGARLYRTGDLARRHADGRVDVLGRVDHQVKIRGHRVEPGEVEAALLAQPGVREAAVRPFPTAAGGLELAGYVVGEVSTAGLRRSLAGVLPDYLVPSALVVLDAFPRTPAGKLDRAALPVPDGVPEQAHVAPRTPTEELVAGVWADALGVAEVGVHDDFFDRGGHSLLANRIAMRLRSALGVAVPVRAVFDHPTVEALSVAIADYPRQTPIIAARRRVTVGEDA
ncbi:non-ribosomal peptide synthetase [Saccharothrix obliqua]|uniref:non-ribosomal peptide synthetase n=1 Tax=Saccharothrix obliqua TaxID=2861747 RepID=UPI001C5D31C0|nr:non-ribosomal peptide synthetase [Saccharothrix obliqua]MBW4718788.1 amino acid adenylation domain-containing protein [Saccharothrix obliqua]